jgi:hypothetical protein
LGGGIAVSVAVTVGLGGGVALAMAVAVGLGGGAVGVGEGVAGAVAVGTVPTVGLATTASALEAVAVNRSSTSLGKGMAVIVGSPTPESIPGGAQPTKVSRARVTSVLSSSNLCFIPRFPYENHRLQTRGTYTLSSGTSPGRGPVPL